MTTLYYRNKPPFGVMFFMPMGINELKSGRAKNGKESTRWTKALNLRRLLGCLELGGLGLA
jgi:hypothetical protein